MQKITVIPTDINDRLENHLFYPSQLAQIILKPPHLTFIIWNRDFEGFGQNAVDKSLLGIQKENMLKKSEIRDCSRRQAQDILRTQFCQVLRVHLFNLLKL